MAVMGVALALNQRVQGSRPSVTHQHLEPNPKPQKSFESKAKDKNNS